MKSLLLEHLAWPDVEAALANGYRTAIVACGAVEQHGPHLPLFVDAEHGTALALSVASKLGNTLVAPTIRVGISEHHMGFPGTMTIQESTFQSICMDYVTSLVRHGFNQIFFIPTHGGNFKPLENMLPMLSETAGADVKVVVYSDLVGVTEVWERVLEEVSGFGERVGGHADIAETSLMEHLHPDLVRRERAEAGYTSEMTDEAFTKMIQEGFKSITPNGILGDARGASAIAGERCIDGLAELLTAYFKNKIAS